MKQVFLFHEVQGGLVTTSVCATLEMAQAKFVIAAKNTSHWHNVKNFRIFEGGFHFRLPFRQSKTILSEVLFINTERAFQSSYLYLAIEEKNILDY